MPRLDKRRMNPNPANIVGSRVREARKLRGYSQSACAEVVQREISGYYPTLVLVIDQSDISRLESGQRPVWDYELRALSVALGVKSDYLLGLSSDAEIEGIDDLNPG